MTATPTSSDFSHSLESETLAAIRDTLLPKLLSGEIRVSVTDANDLVSG